MLYLRWMVPLRARWRDKVQGSDQRLLQKAEGYLELSLPDEAISTLAEVSAQVRQTFEWCYLKGEAHRMLEEYADAAPLFEKARQLRPHIGTSIGLGWCLKRLGRLPEAIKVLRQAEVCCRVGPAQAEHALVMYNLSCYFSLAGEKAQMLQWLRSALRKEPQYRQLIAAEPDFEPFRSDPDFQQLVETVGDA